MSAPFLAEARQLAAQVDDEPNAAACIELCRAAIQKAVEEEREACAETVEAGLRHGGKTSSDGLIAAQAIRERGRRG